MGERSKFIKLSEFGNDKSEKQKFINNDKIDCNYLSRFKMGLCTYNNKICSCFKIHPKCSGCKIEHIHNRNKEYNNLQKYNV